MGAAAVAASKMKSETMKKKLSAAKMRAKMQEAAVDKCLLKVDMKVAVRWNNDDGTPA